MTYSTQYGGWRGLSKALVVVFATSTGAHAETKSILALGDSLTQGYGLEQGTGFVPQLEAWLNAHGADVRLINSGVSGDTTAGGAARIGWALSEDVDGMIVTLGANDMLRGVDPESSKTNLASILDTAQAKDINVLLIGMQAAGNFGPDYKENFDAMYPDLSRDYGTLYMESFFEGLGSVDPAEVQGLMQADGIHPNVQGVALIVARVGPHVLELVDRILED